jgi:FkbM family methyltransferase
MPKLKKFNDKQFVFPVGGKKIIFANNTEQKTYIKNRVDRLLSKEPETIKWLNGFEKNSVFFDIGANIGIYSLYSAIKNENKVYAFEPHSANYKNLLDSINLNKLNNCQAFCFAVSNRISLSHIGVKNMHEGVADNVVGGSGDYYHGCVEIHLDYLVGKKVLPQPDYIKIDVDGFEDRVYKGAMSSIQQAKSVLIEVDQKHEHIVSNIINLGLRLESKHRRNSEEYNYIFVK